MADAWRKIGCTTECSVLSSLPLVIREELCGKFCFIHWIVKWHHEFFFLLALIFNYLLFLGWRIIPVPSLRAQSVKSLLAVQETWVQSLGEEDPLEKGMATHSSILAWKIPWTEAPSGLRSMQWQSQTWLSAHACSAAVRTLDTECGWLVLTKWFVKVGSNPLKGHVYVMLPFLS